MVLAIKHHTGIFNIRDILDVQNIHTGLERYHKGYRERKGAIGDACSGMAAEGHVFKIVYDHLFTKSHFGICTNAQQQPCSASSKQATGRYSERKY